MCPWRSFLVLATGQRFGRLRTEGLWCAAGGGGVAGARGHRQARVKAAEWRDDSRERSNVSCPRPTLACRAVRA
jgi:hypothetical protein